MVGMSKLSASAQNVTPNLKFGKPNMEELSMTTYAPDSSAAAVVLCRQAVVSYIWGADDFRLLYEYKVKVKILKPEGVSHADIVLPYYDKKGGSREREAIANLSASAYNLENGKIIRTKMKDDEVFRERANDYYMQLKFSVPQVKEGTVFEYSYRCYSDFYFEIANWQAQEDIPVLYTDYEITVPEYFQFNVNTQGWNSLKMDRKGVSINLPIGAETLRCSGEQYYFIGEQLPALEGDSYVWCADDFCTQVAFELSRIEIPGSYYKSYTQNWTNIDEVLMNSESFGGRLRMNNPLKAEMATLSLDKYESTADKVCALYQLLKSKLRWNGRYALQGNSARQLLKEGTGDNADINFVLLSMLRDANITAWPVLMSTRTNGRLPLLHPSIQKLNTFIVGVALNDSTAAYIDGSVEDGYLNVLPPNFMVDRARRLKPGAAAAWVDLRKLGKNSLRSVVTATISPEGTMTGHRQTLREGQFSAQLKQNIRQAKDSTEYIRKLEDDRQIKLTALQWKGHKTFSPRMQEDMDFEKQCEVNGDYIYINPLIFLHTSESPFKQAERRLPVEFAFTNNVSLTVSLTIPEGYVIDELPQSVQMSADETNSVTLRYLVTRSDNTVIVRYLFNLNEQLFMPEKYANIQRFWEAMAGKNTEMMVLKKSEI
jgi:transglutaminase-like putative cysteine protease